MNCSDLLKQLTLKSAGPGSTFTAASQTVPFLPDVGKHWVVFAGNASLGLVKAGGQITAFFEFGSGNAQNYLPDGSQRFVLGQMATDGDVGMSFLGPGVWLYPTTGHAVPPGGGRLYVRYPNRIVVFFSSMTVGANYGANLLVLEADVQTDISRFI